MSVTSDAQKRERKMTEKGKEYTFNLYKDEASKLLNKTKQKLSTTGVLFETHGTSRGVLSASLSELSLMRTELSDIKGQLDKLTVEDDSILNKIQEMLQQLDSFIKQKSSSLVKQEDSASSRHGSLASRHSSRTSRSSEAAMRLKAKLELAERERQLRLREARLEVERVEIEAEVNQTRLLNEAVNDQDFHGEDLTRLLADIGTNDTTAQTSHFTNPVDLPQTKTSALMTQNPTMPEVDYTSRPKLTLEPNHELHSITDNDIQKLPLPDELTRNIPTTTKSIGSKINTKTQKFQNSETNLARSWTDPTILLTKIQILNSLVPYKFSGQCEKFPIFRDHIRTHLEDGILPDNERLVFLSRFLEGEALRVFQTNIGLSYKDAVALLERRFGNSAAVTEAWVKRLTEGPPISIYDPKAMLEFSEDLATSTRVLSEDARTEISSKICLKGIVSRLPKKYLSGWIALVEPKNGKETIVDLAEYVKGVARALNHPVYDINSTSKPFGGTSTKRSSAAKGFRNLSESTSAKVVLESKPDVSNKNLTSSKESPCRVCKSAHSLSECPIFSKRTTDQIRQYVQKEGLCYSCLFPGHVSKSCLQRATCKIPNCGKKHPTSLHLYRTPSKPQEENTMIRLATAQDVGTYSFIIPVYVHHEEQPQHQMLVYALLDDGSDSCFISEELHRHLGGRGTQTRLDLATIHAQTTELTYRLPGIIVTSFDRKTTLNLPQNTYTRSNIPSSREEIPTTEVAGRFDHLKVLKNELQPLLPDTELHLLIGNNCPRALCPVEVIRGSEDEPYGVKTDLGWGVIGPRSRYKAVRIRANCQRITLKEVINLFDIAPSQLESLPNQGRGQSVNDRLFIQKIEQGLHQNNDHHYEMPLPLCDDDVKLPLNRVVAEQRLNSLKRKFKDPKFKNHYIGFMNELFKKGYAEEVVDEGEDGRIWYLSHHGVYHPRKPDKIRVVFDCSARFRETSLNDILISSPDLTSSLLGVLFRFRQGQIAFVGDIEGMFLQVLVPTRDRNLLRFLWWENGNENSPAKEYRMRVHLFGAASSPGCANYALRRTATDHGHQISERASKFILRNFYVDDGCGSCDTEEEAIELINELQRLCELGGFRFHKLLSTSAKVIRSIPPDDRASGLKEFETNKSFPLERALGVAWCVEADKFQFRVTIDPKPFTRRGMLATLCSTYDPLGFLAPFVVAGKIILQDLHRKTVAESNNWDDPIPEEIQSRWVDWLEDLASISQETINVPRCYKPVGAKVIKSIQMHHFADASSLGYGHVTYLRFVYDGGKVHCSFMFGKARVRPLKEITIPRLELTAAASLAKASALIKGEIDYDVERIFWTDSRVVLGYIRNVTKRFHVFVANRIQVIHDCSNSKSWHHVPTKCNPADLASRGTSIHELRNSVWLQGPEFLWNPTLPELDQNHETSLVLDCDPEVKHDTKIRTISTETQNEILDRFTYWSSWSRLRKSVAWVLRYISILRYKTNIQGTTPLPESSPNITLKELELAEFRILKLLQNKAFPNEIKESRQGNTKRQNVSNLKSLNPILGPDGLIRVGGRLKRSLLPPKEIHPVILPKDEHLTLLIARHYHERVFHQGRGITMNEIRSKGYWIIGVSGIVSRLINTCIQCRRMRGKFQYQMMADLPSDRITPSAPFTYSGGDVFGPFYVRQGRTQVKRYGMIFTCLVSRAVHIDLLDSMDTSSFINCLRRFLCRRGDIRLLRTDLGTNFVGAKEELRKAANEVDAKRISSFLADHSCQFEFLLGTAKASHMQGAVERMIGSVRRILDYLLRMKEGLLNEDCLRTLLLECESIINSRPLTLDNIQDPNSISPLTPNHLLLLKSPVAPPPGVFEDVATYSKKRWRQVQRLAQEFWSRWKTEYVSSLQRRSKWTCPQRNLREGDIVICHDPNSPRNSWPLARVIKAVPSDDGLVRRVRLLFGKGNVLERPAHSVVLLVPMQSE